MNALIQMPYLLRPHTVGFSVKQLAVSPPVLIYITGMDAQSSFSTQELSQRAQGQHAKQTDGQCRKRLEAEFCLVKSHFATQANAL